MARAAKIAGHLRSFLNRCDLIALFPFVAIVAALLGGDAILWACATVLPILLALQLWSRPTNASTPAPLDTRLSDRDAFLRAADETLLRCAGGSRTTAALMIQVDPLLMVEGEWAAKWPEEIMKRTHERIGLRIRHGDVVARCGEGVIGILLEPVPRADLQIAMSIVDRLQATVAEPVSIDGHTLRVSCAIGMCLEDRSPAANGSALVAAAECALHHARRSGEGSVRAFTKEMQEQVEVEHQLAGLVTEALDSGQIRPWFQPQISTDTGTISGFEALARWHHPDLGILTPAQFLPAIAASHAFNQLGEVMLVQCLKALKSWERAGIRVPTVAINMSLEELRDPRLADRVLWQVDRYDQRPEQICIEILETVTLQDNDDVVIANLKALRSAGFKMDLDDFGTGHASIAHIAKFGVGRIKIDRSFVTGVDVDAKQKRLVSAILSMSDHLGIETLAEGVETPEEHSTLAQLGCGHVQGYGIARPMPFEDTIGWASAHNAKLANTKIQGKRYG